MNDAQKYARQLAERLGAECSASGLSVTTAESCTGGGVAAEITAVAGSSGYFETGYVTYSNAAKQRLLGVNEATLNAHGAVSEAVVREMVMGACRDSSANLGVSISGIAGPGGGTVDKPVGTVWFAWQRDGAVRAKRHTFSGDRDQVRISAVITALEGLLADLNVQVQKG
ncbi:CinA family protein [Phytohalomonas tamaricis]|uniref:CinA family protein n=1 Tax=Phytohalomonas tamaricis TaxID=2081032 RepID=UPI0021D435C8|nr:nicotinamide-nucleotide amidohydrolase family protein [Phytohalomonas tamaricis]